MTLPKMTTPTYELEIPSTDEKLPFRPFLVKEEKILLMAMEENKSSAIINAVKSIVKACTFDKLDISKYPMFDVEYIFLQIRSKSVGETSKLKLLCPDDEKTYADVEVNLTDVKVQVEEGHTNKIEFDNNVGMIMTYPSVDSFIDSDIKTITAENMLDVMSTCVLQIYEDGGEKIYEAKDQTRKELTDFIENLQSKDFQKIKDFFDTMPKLKHTVKFKNPKTKKNNEITLIGLNDFFG